MKTDDELRLDVAAAREAVHALRLDIQVPGHCVKVCADNGWVELSGEVEWEYQRRAAEAAVRALPQVRGVSNLLTLKRKGPLRRRTLGAMDAPIRGSAAHSCFTPKPAA